jgi:hypothetical protein
MSDDRSSEYWKDKQNGREHTEEEVEWFRLWFEFLKLSDREKWTEDVEDYFGDLACSFDNWWVKHRQHFIMEGDPDIVEITSNEEYKNWEYNVLDKNDIEGSGYLILAVPFFGKKDVIRASFEELIKKYHIGVAGRPDFIADQGNVFNFYDRPDTKVLKKILTVYKIYLAEQKKSEDDRMPLWQIEEEASKTIQLINKGDKATYDWKVKGSGKLDDDHQADERRKRSQSSTVSKYIKQAEEILVNITLGCFPVYDGSTPSAEYQFKFNRERPVLAQRQT